MVTRIAKRLTALALTLCIGLTSIITLAPTAEAASAKLTGIGLAEFGLKAYREGWQYYFGAYGARGSNGVRYSDCSGLIFAYLSWQGDNSDPDRGSGMPRGVQSQVDSAVESGPISTLPRTHGLILTIVNNDHVGIYLGNDKSVDNSDYGVNMVYRTVSNYESWIQWHKLGDVEYPSKGWYEFDGDPFYYENGEYVVNTSRTISGVKYTFDSAGTPNPLPKGYGGGNDGGSSGDKLSIAAKTTTDVNFRTGPSKSYPVIRTLSSGTAVTIINKDNPDWYKVRLSDKSVGYVSSDYLTTTTTATPKPTAKPSTNIKAKTTADVRLRAKASTNSTILDVIGSGTSLTIIEKTNSSWYKVKLTDKRTGYMYASYVKVTSGTTTPKPTAKPTATPKPTAKPVSIAATVTASGVNFRKTAGGTVLRTLSKGTKVTITDKSNKDWYKVKLSGGTVGYISSLYLKATTATAKPTATPKPVSVAATVTANDVCIRKTAGGTLIKPLKKGTKVTITNKSNKSWYKVKVSDGTVGYISSQYLKATTVAAKPTATPAGISATVTANDVCIRKTAGGTLIKTLKKGAKVTITDKSNKSWYKVKVSDGTVGYISSQYLSASGTVTKTAKTTAPLNLRKSASGKAQVLTVIPEGATVTVMSTADKPWYKVKLASGVSGYASNEYLK